jgi:hypothetical protein
VKENLLVSVDVSSPLVISSVHFADILDIRAASWNLLSGDSVAVPGKLKVIRSVILDQCSVAPSVTEASCYCALYCVFIARVREFSFMIVM